MAIWQVSFHLVPANRVVARYGAMPPSISHDQYDDTNWWEGAELVAPLREALAAFLSRGRSWTESLEVWGDLESHCVGLFFEGDVLVDVHGRVDLREAATTFLSKVLDLARRFDLLLIIEDRRLCRPEAAATTEAIRQSPSFAFVTDPQAFLADLSSRRL